MIGAPPIQLVGEARDALRGYLTRPDTMNQAESTVKLGVEHNLMSNRVPELRLDRHMTILQVKQKLVSFFGTAPQCQELHLLGGPSGDIVLHDERFLGFYSPEDGMTLRIVDLDPNSLARNRGLEDLSQVQKYVMPDQVYDARKGTFREHKRKMLEQDPNWTLFGSREPSKFDENSYREEAAAIQVGNRCSVTPGGKLGTVRFVGPIPGLPEGFWVGVALDEPVGKNDGRTPAGVRIFECPPNYGVFARPDKVEVGDFPEENFDDLLGADEI
eukprot:gnl/Spiro4/4126_TR2057_c0_g1_i1.p1 gnl/Spiro4/4126_TR2057_c0_g1~~gnl/Spiro4/4126_TR2057_c0_g1_i1.p1  ORF type:complete len:287 (+),score=80.41 gnl/Spiro4/4126_TR2057_c0_g1_i1:46-861(+)